MKSAKYNEVLMKPIQYETRLALIEQSINHINDTLSKLDKRSDQLMTFCNDRFETINRKLIDIDEKLDDKLETFDHRLWTNFYWIMGTVFTLSSILAGLIAKGFHWLN